MDERPLVDHLRGVATRAAAAAHRFGAGEWGHAAGLWHDLGKFQSAWQAYLRAQYRTIQHDQEDDAPSPEHPSHALAGAQYAEQHLEVIGRLLTYVIAGHHAGLADFADQGSLKKRFEDAATIPRRNELELALENRADIPADILAVPALSLDAERVLPADAPTEFLKPSLWIRMLFSCLVDADFLDTESFLDAGRHAQRPLPPPVASLLPAFDAYMAAKAAQAPPGSVNEARAGVLAACRAAGRNPRTDNGIYSLTVPTGGGKTLASLAFALEHARAHGKRRVIYAIPFTSIIDQTAAIFRDIFGGFSDAVLEHHSALDPNTQTDNRHLAAENWDAPVVVTTNVQLFESLFANRTSRCRKVHNIVESVVVLDEAQQIPPAFLKPIVQILRLLARHYGVTVLLCTATQPHLQGEADAFGRMTFDGIGPIHEIVPDPDLLYARLKRVEVELPTPDTPRLGWPDVAAEMLAHDRVLTIVNTRQEAHDLYGTLGPESGRVHLSARMCPAHREHVIRGLKHRLQTRHEGLDKGGGPIRVVATSLIEAGVDIDLPVVYRSLAGMDSIAQAAGRCNREGRLDGLGRVVVFQPEKDRGKGTMQDARDITRDMLAADPGLDALAPETFTAYFKRFYASVDRSAGGKGLDAQDICDCLTLQPNDWGIKFRTAAKRFRLIDDTGQAVIVRYARDDAMWREVEMALNTLVNEPTARWAYRKLQRFTVNLPDYEFKAMLKAGKLEVIAGLYVVYASFYDPELGLLTGDETNVESLNLA